MSGEELMRTIVAAFEQSDLQPLLNALHDDVVWKSASKHEGPFSFKGEYRNRAGVWEVLANISKDYTFQHMRPKEVIAAGDVVWGYFDVSLEPRRPDAGDENRRAAVQPHDAQRFIVGSRRAVR